MEQQQFKVSFSVGTKLLISVVLLLVFVIIFLNVSTVLILTEDKRAYTYQAQSTESVLAGREFLTSARHALDTLKLSLGSVNPGKPPTEVQISALQALVDNQSEVLNIALEWVDPKTGQVQPMTQASKASELKALQIRPDEFKVPSVLMKEAAADLLKSSFTFINASTEGGSPLLAVAFADLKLQSDTRGIPVAIGFISLKGFGTEIKGSHLTIANRQGWVLYDTDPTVQFGKKNVTTDVLFTAAVASQVSTGAKEYEAEGKKFIGSYVRPGLDLVVLSRTDWQSAMRSTYTLTEKFILLGLMAIGAAVIFAILFARTVTAPIKRLYQATRDVASGNFNVELEASSRDEIGALSNSFVAMSKQINELIVERVAKAHLENELQIASTVQQNLFPENRFGSKNIEIFSHYQSASECGGDWWGYFTVDNRMAIMIADATGHGLPSALITASARSAFSVIHKLAQEYGDYTLSPSEMLSYANRAIFESGSGKIMMTFFAGVVDFDAKTLTYASAGHNPPWLFKKSGESYSLKSLTNIGQRLGEALDSELYTEKTVQLDPEDILFLYTDGLMEGKNAEGEQYGKKRTRRVVEDNLSGGPEQVIEALMADFRTHNGDKALDDDITLAAARILGFSASPSA